MTANEILAIPADRPEKLFTGEIDACKAEYRRLAKQWHSDAGGSDTVMAHINVLYKLALDKLADGVWNAPGLLTVTTTTGRVYRMRYKREHVFELGRMYVSSGIVAYIISNEYADLVENAKRMLHNMRYANDAMKAEVKRYLPEIDGEYDLPDAKLIVMRKDADHLCLRDVLNHFKARGLEVRQVAWIISRLHNLVCYFQWAGIVHAGIALDTYFTDFSQHTGQLIGGWWYAARVGQRMQALPQYTLNVTPHKIIAEKHADYTIDLELIRAVGRELLGDAVGTKLRNMKHVPAPMCEWLLSTPDIKAHAYEEYLHWYENVLPQSFGRHKFVKLGVTANDIYKEL